VCTVKVGQSSRQRVGSVTESTATPVCVKSVMYAVRSVHYIIFKHSIALVAHLIYTQCCECSTSWIFLLNSIKSTNDIGKVKIKSPENVCKAFIVFFEFTCITFTTHLYLLFNIVTMDRNALSEPGSELFFYSSVVEISRLLS
jgi:hypothetical protein